MSSKMNFGPEWMRSAPPLNRNTPGNGSSGNLSAMSAAPDDRSPDSTSVLAPSAKHLPVGAAAAANLDALAYTHERMLELFRPQAVTDGFVISDCVFSETPLAPVCLSAPSAKEQELLAGPVNSIASRRYNSSQQQPTYARGGAAQRPNGHVAQLGPRSRPREGSAQQLPQPLAGGDYAGANGARADGLGTSDDVESLWASQVIVRDSVGSFGADGVFRMGVDGGESLERPSPRSSAQSETLRVPSSYSSRAVSPAHAHGAPTARMLPASRNGAAGDGWAWSDLSGAPTTTAAQQRQLVEHAERVKWWYCDPQGNTQGPFSTAHMQEWCSGGYFSSDLQVCHEGGTGFESLGAIISRAGRAQDAFLCAALAFVSQGIAASVGASAPTPPAALSRMTSATHVAPALGNSFGSSAGQLSTLLKEQLLVVSAIGERQRAVVELQDQLQQGLSKLMRELAQESNSIHYMSQVDQTPIPPELLFALQQHARAMEERLRHEYAQLMQVHAAHIAQLESQTDPVIRDILLHNGTASALSFITQRLHELSVHIAIDEPLGIHEQQQQQQQQSTLLPTSAQPPIAPPSPAAQQPTAILSQIQAPNEPCLVAEPVALDPQSVAPESQAATPDPQAAEWRVDEAVGALDKLAISDESSVHGSSGVDGKAPASPAQHRKQKQSGSQKPASKPNSKPAGAPTKKQPADSTAAKTDAISVQPWASVAAPAASALESGAAPGASSAPWSSAAAGAKSKQPKKSLLQIQQEEEAEATKRRQQAENEQRVLGASAQRAGTSYADRLGTSSNAPPPRSLAAIMEEHPAAIDTTPGARPAAKAAKSAAGMALPSMEFLQWCHARLGSLRGINASKFVEVLLTFPVPAPEASLEIISEQIYAYSTTLNGRAFAEDFAKRRRMDHGAIRGGAAKSAPANWMQLLGAQKATPTHGTYSNVASQTSAAQARQPSHQPTGDGSSFQVVGKKGRK
ncbi:kinesin-like protein [Coemansia biformis]|uniref:Kinesin-like protein n=1 Tax=Coemansia biformis TaxID=1286918 RepID=A0A9W8CXW7_9FUNG|nr:kinesin-like protein [Coemansia biformis]